MRIYSVFCSTTNVQIPGHVRSQGRKNQGINLERSIRLVIVSNWARFVKEAAAKILVREIRVF